jgi:hypothetical protein
VGREKEKEKEERGKEEEREEERGEREKEEGREDVFMNTSEHCNYGASLLISGASLGAYFSRSLLLC